MAPETLASPAPPPMSMAMASPQSQEVQQRMQGGHGERNSRGGGPWRSLPVVPTHATEGRSFPRFSHSTEKLLLVYSGQRSWSGRPTPFFTSHPAPGPPLAADMVQRPEEVEQQAGIHLHLPPSA